MQRSTISEMSALTSTVSEDVLHHSMHPPHQKLALGDQVLTNAVVADPHQRKTATSSQLEFFLERFSMPTGEADEDIIMEQFAKYQRASLDLKDDDRIDFL